MRNSKLNLRPFNRFSRRNPASPEDADFIWFHFAVVSEVRLGYVIDADLGGGADVDWGAVGVGVAAGYLYYFYDVDG